MYLTFRQLKYFVEIVRAGSIARASESLHVTATALSLQVKEIEDQFGVSLLIRHSRGIETTSRGAELFKRAMKILELVDDAERSMAALPERRLRLGAPPSIARFVGVETMLQAGDRPHGISVEVVEGWTYELEERLLAGELDVIIGYELRSLSGVVVTDLMDDTFVFAATPALAGGAGSIPLAEVLRSDNLVFYGEHSVSYRGARSAATALGMPLGSHRHVYSISVWRSLLSRGLATTIGSVASIDEEFHHGELVARQIEGNPIHSRIGMGVRADIAGLDWVKAFVRSTGGLIEDRLRADWTDLQVGPPQARLRVSTS